MDRYFKVDIKRLPFSLVWSWGGLPSFAAFVVRKLQRSPAYGNTLVPEYPTITPIEEASADPQLLRAMGPSSDQLLGLGFAPVLLYSSPTIGPSRGLARMSLSTDGRATCLVVAGETSGFSQVVVSLISLLGTGTLLGTSTAAVRLPEVPGVDIVRMPRATAATAAAAHIKRIDGSDARALTHLQALDLITDQQARALRYYVRERIYVEATEADVSEARAGSRAR